LRRALQKPIIIQSTPVIEYMTQPCTTIRSQALAVEALRLMERKKINGLLVVDENDKLVGALNMHNLLRAQVI
jgi:arabinose-5-phosphate isomerase